MNVIIMELSAYSEFTASDRSGLGGGEGGGG